MQIDQIPAGLFVSVAIQVFYYHSVFRADNEAGRGGSTHAGDEAQPPWSLVGARSIAAIAPEGSHAP